MAPPSGSFGGQKLELRVNVFTASEWSEPLKNMLTPKKFVSPFEFDRQAQLLHSADDTSGYDNS